VEWFGSAANYVVVNWNGREGLIRQTLQSLEQELDPRLFARSHRTTIANLAKVEDAEPMADGSWRLKMESGTELVVGRTYRDAILQRLKSPAPRPA
jgi:DNA-binding LytR/AlgR family response regulator